MEEDKNEEEIVEEFISNLVENSQDLDGNIVQMVNQHFWDLI